MIFQWYLFVFLAVVALFAPQMGQVYYATEYGQRFRRYSWLSVFIIIVPMIYWAATRSGLNFGDTSAYASWFENFPNSVSGLPEYLQTANKDKGFAVVSTMIKTLIGNNVEYYFGIIATVCLVCVAYGFRRMSCSFVMSMFLFIASGEYIQWCYNGIRQFIPVSILFAASVLLLKKRYTAFVVLVLAVSTIHATALLMIPMIFVIRGKAWNYRTLIFSTAILGVIAFLDRFTGVITSFMENSQYSHEVDQFLLTEGTNIIRVLVFAIPPLLTLIFKRYIDAANNELLNMCVNMSIISLGIYVVSAFTSGIFIGRLPIYFSLYNYILLPWIVENVFEKRSRTLVYGMIIIAYLVFYYYQVDVTWRL